MLENQSSEKQTSKELHPANRYRFVIAALVLAAHLAVGINFFAVSPVLPLIMEDYGINRGTAGRIVVSPTRAADR